MKPSKCIPILVALALVTVLGCGDENNNVTEPTPSYVQVDRMAIPALNTALIPAAQKETFNRSSPANDVASFKTTVQNSIASLRTAVAPRLGAEDNPGVSPADLAGVLIPDVVTIDFAAAGGLHFPNGRDLTDDVIDAALGLVLNRGDVLGGGPGVADGVGANDVAFLGTFPYLAGPQVLPKPGR